MQNLRWSLRALIKNPGFTLVALLILGLGIGASCAIFSMVDGIVLRALRYREPDRLVHVWPDHSFSAAEFLAFRDQSKAFESVALFNGGHSFTLTGLEQPVELVGAFATADFFSMLGAEPALGRTFAADEDRPGKGGVAVLSHALWQRQFGSEQRIVGRQIKVNGDQYTVIGVLPADFQSLENGTELWLPMTLDPAAADFQIRYSDLIGRLRDGATLESAVTELRTVAQRMRAEFAYLDEDLRGVSVVSLRESLVGGFRRTLTVLALAGLFLLLAACANVAHLQLARTTARSREIGVRLALGVERAQLARQLVVESILLALLAGAFGILLAHWMLRLIVSGLPPTTPRLAEIGIDGRILLFSLALSVLTGLLFGLAPALHSVRSDLQPLLKDGGASTSMVRRRGFSDVLVAMQVGLALVLLVAAGLMVKTLMRLQHINPGFRSEDLLAVRVSTSDATHAGAQQLAEFYERIIADVARIPGVVSVAATQFEPLGGEHFAAKLMFEGKPVDPSAPPIRADRRVVTPGYFRTMGIPVLTGRDFNSWDVADGQQVAIISSSMARRFWPRESALGKRLNTGMDEPDRWLTVVGVVGDVKNVSLAAGEELQLYRPQRQATRFPAWHMTLIVRTQGDPMVVAGKVRAAVWAVDKDVPIASMRTMNEVIYGSIAGSRWIMQLLSAFSAITLVLGAASIYGILSYFVGLRAKEIAVRMSLGAARGAILGLVVRHAMMPVVIGLAFGVAASLGLTKLLAIHLFGVSSTDPSTFVGGTLLLALVALLSTMVPAWRAARVDPTVILRAA